MDEDDPVYMLVKERLQCKIRDRLSVAELADVCYESCTSKILLHGYTERIAEDTSYAIRNFGRWSCSDEEIFRFYVDSVVINAIVDAGYYPHYMWCSSALTKEMLRRRSRQVVKISDKTSLFIFRDHFAVVEVTYYDFIVLFSFDTRKNIRVAHPLFCVATSLPERGLPEDVEEVLRHYIDFYKICRFFGVE
jgi:hypothetical protein